MADDDSKELQVLLEQAKDLQEEMIKLRKRGGDTKIAEIMVMDMDPLVAYFRASEDKKDLAPIQRLLNRVRKEVKDVETAVEPESEGED